MSAIDEVKERADIVEVVSQYLSLQRSGRSFKALCPFHSEKTPSFFVFPERQSWHCFGQCGSGGDAFSFIMKKENIGFGEALRLLAEKTGVSLPRKREEGHREQEKGLEINEAAAHYFHHLLLHNSAAETGRRYLERRGISQKTIEDFELGFSLDSWDALREHLMNQGYAEEELIASGLLIPQEGGEMQRAKRAYDRFRGRLIFPIRNQRGKVTGFGARALDDSTPKYLNSPQTSLFDKSATLYGIHRAREAIQKNDLAIIVEGYMDVLTAHQHGYQNVVASLGTALTERQVGMLKGLVTNFALALDADSAGEEATLRSLENAWHIFDRTVDPTASQGRYQFYAKPSHPSLKIISLPQEKDPDQVIREGAEEWEHLVDEAIPVVEYRFNAEISRLDVSQPRGKSAAVERLFPLITQMEDTFEQDHYFRKLASLLQVDEGTLRASVGRPQRQRAPRRREKVEVTASSLAQAGRETLEEYCLSLLLQYPELREKKGALGLHHFRDVENREIFARWLEVPALEGLRDSLDESLHFRLDFLLDAKFPPTGDREREEALNQCVRRLEERRLKELKAQEELLLSVEEDDKSERDALQQRGIELNAQLKKLFAERKRGDEGNGQRG